MPQANTELVRELLEHLNRGDVDTAMRGVAPGAALDWSLSESIDGGVYEGPEAWAQWMSGRSADLVGAHFEVQELIDVPPDRVVLVAYMRGRGRVSGLEIDALGAAVLTLADGRVTGLKLHQTREEALRAVGLGGI